MKKTLWKAQVHVKIMIKFFETCFSIINTKPDKGRVNC